MTYTELQSKIGTQIETDWHQASGGGWIHKSAKVEDEKLIKDNAIVWGMVSGNAQVSGDALVTGDARVTGATTRADP